MSEREPDNTPKPDDAPQREQQRAREQPERERQPGSYYYDDATGYEIYKPEEDEPCPAGELGEDNHAPRK